jgi:hypothetical protein
VGMVLPSFVQPGCITIVSDRKHSSNRSPGGVELQLREVIEGGRGVWWPSRSPELLPTEAVELYSYIHGSPCARIIASDRLSHMAVKYPLAHLQVCGNPLYWRPSRRHSRKCDERRAVIKFFPVLRYRARSSHSMGRCAVVNATSNLSAMPVV